MMKLVETIEIAPSSGSTQNNTARAVASNALMLSYALRNLRKRRPSIIVSEEQVLWNAVDKLSELLADVPSLSSAQIRSFSRNLEAAALSAAFKHSTLSLYSSFFEECYLVVRDIANKFHVKNRIKKTKPGDKERSALVSISDYYRLGTIKSENRLVQLLECISGKGELISTPSRITIEPSSMCNFRCPLCPQGMHEGRPEFTELNGTQISNLADFFPALYSLAVQVIGEPTLSAQLRPIAELARLNNVGIDMITNGSMLHLSDAPMEDFASICISFDGATKEVFEAHRIGANFELIIRNIRTLRAQAPMVRIEFNVCVTRLNMAEIPGIAEIAAKIGVDLIRFSPLQTSRSTTLQSKKLFHLDDLVIKDDEMAKLFDLIHQATTIASENGIRIINTFAEFHSNPDREDRLGQSEMISGLTNVDNKKQAKSMSLLTERLHEISADIPSGLDSLCRQAIALEVRHSGKSEKIVRLSKREEPQGLLPNPMRGAFDRLYEELAKSNDKFPQSQANNRRISLPYCSAPWVGGLIFSTGDYAPCCYLAGEDYGDINEVTAREFWNNQRLNQLRRQLADSSDDMPTTCKNCNALQRYQFVGQMLEHISFLGYEWDDIDWPANFNPIPAHVAQINEIRWRLFDSKGNRKLDVNTEVDFSESASDPFVAFGFGAIQPAGRWSEGSLAAIVFEIDEDIEANKIVRFELSVMPFVDKSIGLSQVVEFSINQKPLFETELVDPNLATIDISISGDFLRRGINRIAMNLPHAVSPRSVGKNKNWALRAVLIRQLRRIS